jgi:hypothetical protein
MTFLFIYIKKTYVSWTNSIYNLIFAEERGPDPHSILQETQCSKLVATPMSLLFLPFFEESQGFEPWDPEGPPLFKSGAISQPLPTLHIFGVILLL